MELRQCGQIGPHIAGVSGVFASLSDTAWVRHIPPWAVAAISVLATAGCFGGSHATATVRAGSDGRFAVDLAPGTYRVVVTGHAPRSDGRWLPTTPSEVTVGPDVAGSIRIVVSIK
jgi:hypothetical protein